MKRNIIFFLLTFLALIPELSAQQFPNIDPKWDNYYNSQPTAIRQNHQASDFISVIDEVGFVPSMPAAKKNVAQFKRVLLSLGQDDLNQMAIDGNYHSRTKKHDDYFALYNTTYKPINKETWNRLCPYLIPLMNVDGLISFN